MVVECLSKIVRKGVLIVSLVATIEASAFLISASYGTMEVTLLGNNNRAEGYNSNLRAEY